MPGPVRDPGKIKGPTYIPQCAAVRLIWLLPNGKQASNILHASYTGALTLSQAFVNGVFTGVSSALTSSAIIGLLHTATQLQAVGIRDLRQDPTTGFGMGEWVSQGTAVAGTSPVANNAMPANVAFVVSLKTGFSRQANRGRVYLTGFATNADAGNGIAAPGLVTDAPAFITAVQSTLNAQATALSLCIAHPARQSYPSRTPGAPAIPARNAGTVLVTNIISKDNIWDTQRLRVRP